jgi:hypothetical protein
MTQCTDFHRIARYRMFVSSINQPSICHEAQTLLSSLARYRMNHVQTNENS